MNIRKNLFNSEKYNFIKHNGEWHNHELYKLVHISEKHIRENFDLHLLNDISVYLGLTDEAMIMLSDLRLEEAPIEPDFLIFASRHRSKTGRPAFLAHTTGNWNEDAKFGGNPQEIVHASAFLLKAAYNALMNTPRSKNVEKFKIDLEVTHHGPTSLKKPLIFIELGSSRDEWKIEEAGEFIAEVIMNTIITYLNYLDANEIKVGLGFGGTHYTPQFQKVMKTPDVAISHICPKYFIQDLDEHMITQMIEKTKEKVDYFLIDWKGTNSADKSHLMPLLEKFDIPINKSKEVR